MFVLTLFFLLSIVFSFLCSVWEAVLLSITPSYITTQTQKGTSLGTTLKEFKEDIDRPLSAILTLNTIAHTVGAIGVGAQAGKVFGDNSFSIGGYELSFEALIAGFMTLSILILSEIIPKTIGANNWKSLAPFTVRCLRMLIVMLLPLVWISQRITKLLKKDKSASVLSRADILAMASQGAEEGAIDASESKTIDNLLRLKEIVVNDIMTPASVMKSTFAGKKIVDFYNEDSPLVHSRMPVFHDERREVVGILLKDDLFEAIIKGKGNEHISTLMREPIFVSNTAPLTDLRELFVNSGEMISTVTDEFGNVVGIVTWEDLLETILGLEIVDEKDSVADMQMLAKQLWEERRRRKKS